jgi:hypothetical protein
MPDDRKCLICGVDLTSERIADNWGVCEKCEIKDNDNWLDCQEIECPSCSQRIILVIHSPFYNEHFLYCDSCPRHVEVSFYDPNLAPIRKRHAVDEAKGDDWDSYFTDLEDNLRPCPCGGTFSNSASRRCPYCACVIPYASEDKDVYPKDESFEFDLLIVKNEIWK